MEAFVSLIKEYGGREYDFRIRETQTYEIIEDVAKLKSEVGILYLNSLMRLLLKKHLKKMIYLFIAFLLPNLMSFLEKTIH